MKNKISSIQIEIEVARYFGVRNCIIVPNVFWGMGFAHECDLFVLTKANYGYEIEIKVSKQDLKKDLDKWHKHDNYKISKLYFAIPDSLVNNSDIIPDKAGILVVKYKRNGLLGVEKIREAKRNYKYEFPMYERLKLARLGTMRIFDLKETAEYHSNQYELLLSKYRKLNALLEANNINSEMIQ